jgi:hypothetical protein
MELKLLTLFMAELRLLMPPRPEKEESDDRAANSAADMFAKPFRSPEELKPLGVAVFKRELMSLVARRLLFRKLVLLLDILEGKLLWLR